MTRARFKTELIEDDETRKIVEEIERLLNELDGRIGGITAQSSGGIGPPTISDDFLDTSTLFLSIAPGTDERNIAAPTGTRRVALRANGNITINSNPDDDHATSNQGLWLSGGDNVIGAFARGSILDVMANGTFDGTNFVRSDPANPMWYLQLGGDATDGGFQVRHVDPTGNTDYWPFTVIKGEDNRGQIFVGFTQRGGFTVDPPIAPTENSKQSRAYIFGGVVGDANAQHALHLNTQSFSGDVAFALFAGTSAAGGTSPPTDIVARFKSAWSQQFDIAFADGTGTMLRSLTSNPATWDNLALEADTAIGFHFQGAVRSLPFEDSSGNDVDAFFTADNWIGWVTTTGSGSGKAMGGFRMSRAVDGLGYVFGWDAGAGDPPQDGHIHVYEYDTGTGLAGNEVKAIAFSSIEGAGTGGFLATDNTGTNSGLAYTLTNAAPLIFTAGSPSIIWGAAIGGGILDIGVANTGGVLDFDSIRWSGGASASPQSFILWTFDSSVGLEHCSIAYSHRTTIATAANKLLTIGTDTNSLNLQSVTSGNVNITAADSVALTAGSGEIQANDDIHFPNDSQGIVVGVGDDGSFKSDGTNPVVGTASGKVIMLPDSDLALSLDLGSVSFAKDSTINFLGSTNSGAITWDEDQSGVGQFETSNGFLLNGGIGIGDNAAIATVAINIFKTASSISATKGLQFVMSATGTGVPNGSSEIYGVLGTVSTGNGLNQGKNFIRHFGGKFQANYTRSQGITWTAGRDVDFRGGSFISQYSGDGELIADAIEFSGGQFQGQISGDPSVATTIRVLRGGEFQCLASADFTNGNMTITDAYGIEIDADTNGSGTDVTCTRPYGIKVRLDPGSNTTTSWGINSDGDIQVASDMKLLLEGTATVKGDTYFLYDSGNATLDCFVGNTEVWNASTTVVTIPVSLDVTFDARARQIICDGDNAGVAATNSLTGATDTPTTDPGWAASSTTDMNAPDGYVKAYVGTQAVVIPYWNT